MFEGIRLVTIHPALVHFTLGVIPVALVAYGAAVWRPSAAWTFAGDVAVTIAAAITLATLAFGLVSNAILQWPGGLEVWRYLHLAFGICSTALLVGIAISRLILRRRRPISGIPTFGAMLFASIVIGFTGWIGGEVLVYHSGMAVRAAGEGTLAPPVHAYRTPNDFQAAMDETRGAFSAVHVELATMIVHHPDPRGFERIANQASSLVDLARWIQTQAPGAQQKPQLVSMAQLLEKRAAGLKQAADQKDLIQSVHAAAQIEMTCAGCHQALRWSK